MHDFVACYGHATTDRQWRAGDRRRGDGDARRRSGRPGAGGRALSHDPRNQLRRDRRAEPQLCRAQPRQPRRDAQRRGGVAAARRRAAGHRQDARQPRARAGPGHFRAPAAPGARLARRAWHDHRRGRAAHRRQCDERLGDVGGQCRDGQPRARYRRRQLPPDRRQPADHAAPQPRMAGDAGAAAAGLRRRSAFAVHGPVPPAFGDEGAANHMRLAPAHGEPGVEVFVYGVVGRPLPRPPACRGVEGDRPAPPARPGAHHVRRAERGSDRRRRVPQ